jgi:membrane fusion protein
MIEKLKLYRSEALAGRQSGMFGGIQLAQPVPLTAMTGLVLVITGFVVAFLVFGEYARKVTVQGYLKPDAGVARVHSPTDGVASRVLVSEGDYVAQGEPLVEISTARGLADGNTAHAEIIEELASQQTLLKHRLVREQKEHLVEMRWLDERRSLALIEADKIQSTYVLQQQRIELSREQADALKKLKVDGFVSSVQVLQFDADRLSEEKQLAELSLRLTQAEIETRNISRLIEHQPVEHRNLLDTLRRELASINQQIKQIRANSQFVVYAPVSGKIANRNVFTGAQVLHSRALITIVPAESPLFAWLLIPSRAAGFATAGNQVRLMYDSFPYQQFGTQRGEIVSVSNSAISKLEIAGLHLLDSSEPVFIAKVRLAKDTVTAFGDERALQVDMLLTADIVLAKRSIFEWVLEPLYALRGRT